MWRSLDKALRMHSMDQAGMTKTTILHNPRCSKSRAAMELLQSRGLEVQVIKYLETPPTAEQLGQIVALLGLKPVDLIRQGEPLFDKLGLADKSLSDAQWLDVLVDNPQLIERPIVVHNGRAAIGRPVERIVEILDA